MLQPVQVLYQQLLNLPEETDRHTAAVNFINIVADFINQVQAGPTGSPGILTYMNQPAVAQIESLPEVDDQSWITNFANAIHIGATSGILVPGTVMFPAWTASMVDVLPPENIGLSSAYQMLVAGLQPVSYQNQPPMQLAQAIHDYASGFMFLCTGLVLAPPGAPVPLPVTFNAL